MIISNAGSITETRALVIKLIKLLSVCLWLICFYDMDYRIRNVPTHTHAQLQCIQVSVLVLVVKRIEAAWATCSLRV